MLQRDQDKTLMLNLKSRVLNRLHVGFSLSRNFMKRLGQKVLVNARFYFYLLQKPAHFFSSSN